VSGASRKWPRVGGEEVEEAALPETEMKNLSKAAGGDSWVYNVWNWDLKVEIPAEWNCADLA